MPPAATKTRRTGIGPRGGMLAGGAQGAHRRSNISLILACWAQLALGAARLVLILAYWAFHAATGVAWQILKKAWTAGEAGLPQRVRGGAIGTLWVQLQRLSGRAAPFPTICAGERCVANALSEPNVSQPKPVQTA